MQRAVSQMQMRVWREIRRGKKEEETLAGSSDFLRLSGLAFVARLVRTPIWRFTR
jgi:hypothetical protein